MNITNNFKKGVIKETLSLLPKISDKNIIKATYLLEKVAPKAAKDKIKFVRKLYQENHPVLTLTKRALTDIDKNCQEKFLENFIFTGLLENQKKREKAEKEGLPPLFTLLISPSMRCNLNCKGCYAKNYKKEDDLPFEILDRVIQEAKKIGVAFFTILGGEPFIREDIFDIFKKHSDAYFQVYTNGTLINDKLAKKIKELGNVLLEISIEGFENETDYRRGEGTFKKVIKAMDILKENHVPFGYSVCVTKKNAETVVSDKFIDFLIEKGALIGWYFLYMPVCGDKNTDLMPTPEQRNNQRIRRDYIRNNKPIFIIDFWNDAPYVGGCIASKYYAHITNFGDVEPCIFTHFAQVNIKNTSLKEALNCQFFKEIRKRQPYSPNLLMPCMLIDHPHIIRELHKICDIYPTHPKATTLVEDLKDEIDKYSLEVHKIYDKIWEEQQK